MPRFSLRDLFWLTLVVALTVGCCMGHQRLAAFEQWWMRAQFSAHIRDTF